MNQFPFSLDFKFDLALWRESIVSHIEPRPESDAILWVDPAYFSDIKKNDQSALVVATKETQDDGARILTILDGAADWFRGIALPNKIVHLAQKWSVNEIRIERNGNGSPDLLGDVIKLRAEQDGITLGRVSFFNPVNQDGAKRRRIFKLHGLLTDTPQTLRLCKGPYVAQVLEQCQQFCFDSQDNHAREDGLLDVIALAAFGR